MEPVGGGADHDARLRGGIAFVLLSAAFVLLWQSTTHSAWATPPSDCLASSHGVGVHYLTDLSGGDPVIAGLEIHGLDPATCEGQPVTVTLSGNEAGDPTQAPTKTLSVLDSSLEPCTGAPLSPPVVVAGGRITLHGCSTVTPSSGAAFANIHDATRLTIEVAGTRIPMGGGASNVETPPTIEDEGSDGSGNGSEGNDTEVLGVEQLADSRNSGEPTVPTAVDARGLMPDTGGPRNLTLWLGVLLVSFGVVSLLWDLAKPRPSTAD